MTVLGGSVDPVFTEVTHYENGAKVDHFEIVENLGEGAYAETYRALDTKTGATVVLKSPRTNLIADPAIFARFRREAEIARTLDHPGLPRSVDRGESRSDPYLVLEYIEGENFRRYLRRYEGAVPVEIALDWGKQLGSVLAYLHAHGVVHRDLKPENLIITPEGRLKVIDFGTALLEGARRLTWRHLSESLGTPDYMSPEQIQGERGDPRSDIYAWGSMMYEFLAGHLAFGGENWTEVMAAHLTKDPAPIRRANANVPRPLEAIVLKAMRRYPANRYQDAGQLLADLERLDTLDAAGFDLSPEPPMGGMAALESAKRLWIFVAIVALSFIAFAAVVIALAVLL